MHWDVGGRRGGKASQGLTTFLDSFACLILNQQFFTLTTHASDNLLVFDAAST